MGDIRFLFMECCNEIISLFLNDGTMIFCHGETPLHFSQHPGKRLRYRV